MIAVPKTGEMLTVSKSKVAMPPVIEVLHEVRLTVSIGIQSCIRRVQRIENRWMPQLIDVINTIAMQIQWRR